MLKLFKLLYLTKQVGIVIRGELKLNDVYINTFFKYMYSMTAYVNNFMKNKSTIGIL